MSSDDVIEASMAEEAPDLFGEDEPILSPAEEMKRGVKEDAGTKAINKMNERIHNEVATIKEKKAAVAQATDRLRPYAITEDLDIVRAGPDVLLTLNGKESVIRSNKIPAIISSITDAGKSPEMETCINFLMTAPQAWVDWMARRVLDAEESHGPPPQEV